MQYNNRTAIYCRHLLVQFLTTTDDPHSYCSLSFSLSPHTHTHTHTQEAEVQLYPYLTPALDGVGSQCHILAALLWERDAILIVQEVGWVQKILPPRGFEPWILKPTASHYPAGPTPLPLSATHMHKHTNHRLIHYELAADQEHVLYKLYKICLTTTVQFDLIIKLSELKP